MNSQIDIKYIQYLLNLKALNYLKQKNLIDDKTYGKSIVQIQKIAQ